MWACVEFRTHTRLIGVGATKAAEKLADLYKEAMDKNSHEQA
jgi:hypothetical protein